MAIRVSLECGHASMLRVRLTPQGYTHDWEVFVRGVDNADISHYVDKVVFHLHTTFPKPKRILKEPPYIVKESGYAGFVIPIDVYLKNKDEPKRIQFSYDLVLLPNAPTNNVIRRNELFFNPSDEFRKKLLKGGGIAASNSDDSGEKGDLKMVPPMVSKPKLSGTEVKKHRTTDLRTSNSFVDLFGNPMTLPAKVSPDQNKRGQSDKVVAAKSVSDKTEKLEKPAKTKHSPHKDKKRDKSADERKEKKDRSLGKEKERAKEKSKRPPSPGAKDEFQYGTVKKTSSPSSTKKPVVPPPAASTAPGPTSTPALSSTSASSLSSANQKPQSPKSKDKEHQKIYTDKEKEKMKETFKTPAEDRKFDRKKKKHKEDKNNKERKEKESKDRDHEKTKDSSKKSDKKIVKSEKHDKPEKDRSHEVKVSREEKKSPKHSKDKDKIRTEKADKTETIVRTKDSRTEKEKQKHKHKRKEKKERAEESGEKEKSEKIKNSSEKKGAYSSPSMNPLSTLIAELPERDSSDSTHSNDDEPIPSGKTFVASKNDSETSATPVLDPETSKTASSTSPQREKHDGDERIKREKTKSSRDDRGGSDGRKRKRKTDVAQEDGGVKRSKDRGNSASPSVEPVSSSQSPISIDIDSSYNFKDTASSNAQANSTAESEQVAPDSTNNTFTEPEAEAAVQTFSDDYVSQLKELQRKIMTLQDNQELQRVVQVIAETGQYEITRKTFDFDLCALDRRTVQRLQQFFSSS